MPASNFPIFGPVDDLTLGVFRRFFAEQPNVHIGTLFTVDINPPMVIARRERKSGTMANRTPDDRFLLPAVISVNTIVDGVDADQLGDQLQEACRQALRTAQQEQWMIPNGGVINKIENSTGATRVNDWATSTGVVQYASLPKGWVRHESIYRLLIRPPAQSTITNPFITPGQ